MTRVHAQGPPRPQAPYRPHRVRDHPRRRDRERHVRAHRLDRHRRSTRSSARSTGTRTRVITEVRLRRTSDNGPSRRRSTSPSLAKVKAAAGRRRTRSAASRTRSHQLGKNGKAIIFGGAPNLGFSASTRRSPQFNSAHPREGLVADGHDEIVVDELTPGPKDLAVGGTIGVQVDGPRAAAPNLGYRQVRSASSIGGATLGGLRPRRPPSGCSTRRASSTRSALSAKPGSLLERLWLRRSRRSCPRTPR